MVKAINLIRVIAVTVPKRRVEILEKLFLRFPKGAPTAVASTKRSGLCQN